VLAARLKMTLRNIQPLLYLDFLGFSDKILSQRIEESVEYYKYILQIFESYLGDSKFKINFDIVSDSAFLWVEGDVLYLSSYKLFQIASTFMHNSLFNRMPIRGAIVFDEFIIGDRVFQIRSQQMRTHLVLGKAIINGHKWEQTQNWFGISISPNYIDTFKKELPGLIEKMEEKRNIILYNIPTKNEEVKSYAVNGFIESFVKGMHVVEAGGVTYSHSVDNYFNMLSEIKTDVTDPSIVKKLTNTENYLKYVDSNLLYRLDNNEQPSR